MSFSIKKPKEAEILKDVKSALPVEEESSEEEAEVEGDPVVKSSAVAQEVKPAIKDPEIATPPTTENPEEEMKRLQQLLREKEYQLREQERLRKISEKRSQDIFQIETPDTSTKMPPLPATPPPLPSLSPPAGEMTECNAEVNEEASPKETEMPINTGSELAVGTDSMPGEKPSGETEQVVIADEPVNATAETEVIDLTEEADDLPKVSGNGRKAPSILSVGCLIKFVPFT